VVTDCGGRLDRAAAEALVTVFRCSKEIAKSIAASSVAGLSISTCVFMGSPRLFVKISRSSASEIGFTRERFSRKRLEYSATLLERRVEISSPKGLARVGGPKWLEMRVWNSP
jgi:hypothetical protein